MLVQILRNPTSDLVSKAQPVLSYSTTLRRELLDYLSERATRLPLGASYPTTFGRELPDYLWERATRLSQEEAGRHLQDLESTAAREEKSGVTKPTPSTWDASNRDGRSQMLEGGVFREGRERQEAPPTSDDVVFYVLSAYPSVDRLTGAPDEYKQSYRLTNTPATEDHVTRYTTFAPPGAAGVCLRSWRLPSPPELLQSSDGLSSAESVMLSSDWLSGCVTSVSRPVCRAGIVSRYHVVFLDLSRHSSHPPLPVIRGALKWLQPSDVGQQGGWTNLVRKQKQRGLDLT
ncbi:hypothetical protein BaRGS_00018969, partial [Batillaria attramentaria]